jgi:hypothetical protein
MSRTCSEHGIEVNLPSVWVASLALFVGVYVLTQWLDEKIVD